MALTKEGREHLEQGLHALNIQEVSDVAERLSRYLCLIEETNKHTNLTRITGDAAVTGHFLDALSLVHIIDLNQIESFVDVGTGLGVPGLVLKLAFPHVKMLLVDSLLKRTRFLEEVIQALGVNETEVIHGRGEEVSRDKKYRERYDLSVARAVSSLDLVGELSIPFLKIEGTFAAYKGKIEEAELQAAKIHLATLGVKNFEVTDVVVPFLEAQRVIVWGKKVTATPSQYPRSSKALAQKK